MNSSPEHISFSVAANALAETRAEMRKILEDAGAAEEIVEGIVLAVDEAMTNIARHAYRNDDGMVDVEIILEPKKITVLLLHSGEQFLGDVPSEEDIARHVSERRRGGYGLFLMKKNLDELEFGVRGNLGFIRLMKKRT